MLKQPLSPAIHMVSACWMDKPSPKRRSTGLMKNTISILDTHKKTLFTFLLHRDFF
jgi:hypothetical protein